MYFAKRLLSISFSFVVAASFGQTTKITTYDPHVLFSPLFYATGANEYRAGDGEPGPKYWQNRANYQISASLDDVKDEITGSVTVSYTNNSPHALSFLWLQLDQNLYDLSSRGQSKIPAMGRSRYGDPNSTFKGGYRINAVKILPVGKTGESVNAQNIVTDTRMQIRLPHPVSANGGTIKFRIDYSFSIPKYGSDRTGILSTKMATYMPLHSGIRGCVYLMISRGGIHCLTLVQVSFILNMVILILPSMHLHHILLWLPAIFRILPRYLQLNR